MILNAPFVKAEQHGAISIEELPEIPVSRSRDRLAEQRLIPLETTRDILDADNRPGALHVSALAPVSVRSSSRSNKTAIGFAWLAADCPCSVREHQPIRTQSDQL